MEGLTFTPTKPLSKGAQKKLDLYIKKKIEASNKLKEVTLSNFGIVNGKLTKIY